MTLVFLLVFLVTAGAFDVGHPRITKVTQLGGLSSLAIDVSFQLYVDGGLNSTAPLTRAQITSILGSQLGSDSQLYPANLGVRLSAAGASSQAQFTYECFPEITASPLTFDDYSSTFTFTAWQPHFTPSNPTSAILTLYLSTQDTSAPPPQSCSMGATEVAWPLPLTILASAPLPMSDANFVVSTAPCATTATCNDTIAVSWSSLPNNNQGFVNTGYLLYYSSNSSLASAGVLNITNTSLIHTLVSGLIPGTTYYFAMAAYNGYGQIGPLTSIKSLMAGTVPQAPPAAPTVTVLSTTALQLTWVDGHTGGPPLTQYLVECSTDALFPAGITIPRVLPLPPANGGYIFNNSLVTGQSYFCRITPSNVLGSALSPSPFNLPSVLLATVPAQVQGVQVTPLNPTSLGVAWLALGTSGSGGVPVQEYVVEWNGGHNLTVSGTTTSCGLSGLVSGTNYTIQVQALNVVGYGLPSASVTLSQPGPAIISGVVLMDESSGPTANVSTNSTCSSSSNCPPVVVTGSGFLRYAEGFVSTVGVTYCQVGGPGHCYSCAVVPVSVNDTSIECELAPGVGQNFYFIVRSGPAQVASLPSPNWFSYPPPTITAGTLRRPDGVHANPLPALSSEGEIVVMDGSSFGDLEGFVTVTYGDDANPNQFSCQLLTLSDTSLSCLTQTGAGQRNLRFTVNVDGQTVRGVDVYNYPTTPIIHNVSGCTPSLAYPNSTVNCPTSGGGLLLTLQGQYLTEPLQISVRGADCPLASISPPTMATCWLPAGAGLDQTLVVTQQLFVSDPLPLISYAPPTVVQVMGCPFAGCNRTTSSDVLTIQGLNFGAERTRAFVGGVLCVAASNSPSTPHELVYCQVPRGAGSDLVVSVEQYEGELSSQINVTMSYASCDVGTFIDGLDCPPCPNGTANDLPAQLFCPDCKAGLFADTSGTLYCLECEMGFFSDRPRASSCQPCPAGYVAGSMGQAFCTPCPPGTFASNASSSFCLPCPTGRINPTTNATSCQLCPEGQTADPNRVVCLDCGVGRFSSGPGSLCVACEPGTYQDGTAVTPPTSCSNCTQGRFAADNGTVVCTLCPRGLYTAGVGVGSSSCEVCDPGLFQNETGATSCEPCGPGTFASSHASVSCTPCPPGLFASGNRSTDCLSCGAGFYSGGSGHWGCAMCPSGRFSNYDAATRCFDCVAGQYSQAPATRCLDCPNGTATAVANASSCAPCPNGTFASVGSRVCLPCTTGRFCPPPLAAEAQACPAGTYAPQNLATACLRCHAGTYSRGGDPTCLLCEEGTFSNVTASSSCMACSTGQYQPASNQTACLPCGPGTYQNGTGAFQCAMCAPGFYWPGGAASACTVCGSGKYVNEPGATTCTSCGAGLVLRATPMAPGQGACVDSYVQEASVQRDFWGLGLAGLGVVAVLVAFWTLMYHNRVVQWSSPVFMYAVMVGCALLFVSVILWIVDQTPVVCHVKNVLLNVGAGLVLMSIVVKTWRLHKIFHRAPAEVLKGVIKITDWDLLWWVVGAVVMDLVALGLWVAIAPFSIEQPIERCSSAAEPGIHAFLWGWKLAAVLALCWWTWDIRNIDPRFNESQWIVMALFNAALVVTALVILTLDRPAPRLWVAGFAALVWYLTLSSLVLVFGPKVWRMRTVSDEVDVLYGPEMAAATAESREVVEREQSEAHKERVQEKKGYASGNGDDGGLQDKLDIKVRRIQKLLDVMDKAKQRAKTDLTQLHELLSDVLTLRQEINYRKKLLQRTGREPRNREDGAAMELQQQLPSLEDRF